MCKEWPVHATTESLTLCVPLDNIAPWDGCVYLFVFICLPSAFNVEFISNLMCFSHVCDNEFHRD